MFLSLLVHLISSLRVPYHNLIKFHNFADNISYHNLVKFHDFAENSQEGMKHQMRGATQAQQGVTWN
jgi:hypothetical protein